jgi:hypothetical protein
VNNLRPKKYGEKAYSARNPALILGPLALIPSPTNVVRLRPTSTNTALHSIQGRSESMTESMQRLKKGKIQIKPY